MHQECGMAGFWMPFFPLLPQGDGDTTHKADDAHPHADPWQGVHGPVGGAKDLAYAQHYAEGRSPSLHGDGHTEAPTTSWRRAKDERHELPATGIGKSPPHRHPGNSARLRALLQFTPQARAANPAAGPGPRR